MSGEMTTEKVERDVVVPKKQWIKGNLYGRICMYLCKCKNIVHKEQRFNFCDKCGSRLNWSKVK